jgi:hypothetical protein
VPLRDVSYSCSFCFSDYCTVNIVNTNNIATISLSDKLMILLPTIFMFLSVTSFLLGTVLLAMKCLSAKWIT